MGARFNHSIVHARSKEASARFLTEILGLPQAKPLGHFLVVAFDNGVSLDFCAADGTFERQHYAFEVTETDLEAVLDRIRARGIAYWADPGRTRAGEVYHHNGGRGLYFEDPDGHLLEALTKP
jgi:catechol 2,3-dioxygenase-like lactoylglutathione lyase family enzyme